MKDPAIFLAQFAGSKPPFDRLETMAHDFAESSTDPAVHARIVGLDPYQ